MSCVHIRYIMLIRNIKIHIDPPQIRERAVIGSGCEPLIFRQNLSRVFCTDIAASSITEFPKPKVKELEFRQVKFALEETLYVKHDF